MRIGIRREDRSVWERRVPITPADTRRLVEATGLEVWVQSSGNRIFRDAEFRRAGATIVEDLAECPVVFGVKEMPPQTFQPGHTYVFFAHVIKGQAYNMPMLRRLLDLGCQLIDYEKVTDEHGRRLIFFGRHAGLAGMIDTLWALGKRLEWEGIANPFSQLQQTHEYATLADAKAAVSAVGEAIGRVGLPTQITPCICGFAGYGNVFRGANEIIELLPVQRIKPAEVESVATGSESAGDRVFQVVFREKDTVAPDIDGHRFDLQHYYDHPEAYHSQFGRYLPYLSLLVNCIYWEERYPRLVTKADIRALFGAADRPALRVIGDISCDIEGAIELTVKATEPGDPVYVYDATTDTAVDGVAGHGPAVMAVDILPSELSRAASVYFSSVLTPHVPAIARADYSVPFEDLALPSEIRRALIVHQGELTPGYGYLRKHLGR